jgi:hypothetical protein
MHSRLLRRRQRFLFLVSASVSITSVARALDENDWTGSVNNSWSVRQNWSQDLVPQNGQDVIIITGGGNPPAVNYDYTGTPVTLSTLELDIAADEPGEETMQFLANDTLSVSTQETIGGFGLATVDQQDGMNKITNGLLKLGDMSTSDANYFLFGTATLSVMNTSSGSVTEIFGNIGGGNFSQFGGLNTTNGKVVLSEFFGSTGVYSIAGGTLSCASLSVGDIGTGLFFQTFGLVQVTQSGLQLGSSAQQAQYKLIGGTLQATGGESLVQNDAEFTQTGGNNQCTGTFLIDGQGTASTVFYSESGGSVLTIIPGSSEMIDNGSFGLTAGLNLINTGDLIVGSNAFTGANAVGNYALRGGTLFLSTGTEYIADGANGNFSQSGGLNSINGSGESLYVGYNPGTTGTYALSATGSLFVAAGLESVGYNGVGTFTQSGGNNFVAANDLEIGVFAGATGTYSISGGTLSAQAIRVGGSAANSTPGTGGTGFFNISGTGLILSSHSEFIGEGGPGQVNQSGGTNFLDVLSSSLAVGESAGVTGTYILSGGTLSVDGNEFVGNSGIGIFNQSGGLNQTNLAIAIGENSGSFGTYVLSGGTLSAGNEGVAGALFDGSTGTFVQSGGLNQFTDLTMAFAADSTASFALSGTGTIACADSEALSVNGKSNFTQSGGLNQIVGGQLAMAELSGATASYSLSGGLLTAPSVYVGGLNGTAGGTGVLSVSGGALMTPSTGTLTVFNTPGSSISLTGGLVSTGVLNLSGNFNLFQWTTGTLALTNTSRAVVIDNSAQGNLAATLTLGAKQELIVSSTEVVGKTNSGSLTLSGGTNIIAGDLQIAANAGSTGTFLLNSTGSLSAVNVYVGGSNSAAGGRGVLTVTNAATMSVSGQLKAWNNGRANLDVSKTTVTGLNITGNGIVNLNGALAVNYAGAFVDPVATIVSYLQNGFDSGNWDGTSGIVSTSVAGSSQAVSIGYADSKTDVGTPAAANQVLIQYTLLGDANLDGLVNFNDLVAVVQNFNKPGTDWSQGNFQYGASTNFNDLVAVVQNFNKVLAPPSGSGDLGDGGVIPLTGSRAIVLPEPGLIFLAASVAAGLRLRRRRGH